MDYLGPSENKVAFIFHHPYQTAHDREVLKEIYELADELLEIDKESEVKSP